MNINCRIFPRFHLFKYHQTSVLFTSFKYMFYVYVTFNQFVHSKHIRLSVYVKSLLFSTSTSGVVFCRRVHRWPRAARLHTPWRRWWPRTTTTAKTVTSRTVLNVSSASLFYVMYLHLTLFFTVSFLSCYLTSVYFH